MNKKYIITILGLSTLLVSSTNFAFAQTATSTATPQTKHEFKINPNRSNTTTTASLTAIQQKADQLITERLNSLHTMLTKINGMTRLSADQKTQLTASINADITGLTNLKAKIDGDTDIATALADTKSIYTTYRVYAEFAPKTGMIAASDALSKSIDQLMQLSTKLQTRISSASAAGSDVTTLNALITDMQNKIADAKTQATNAQNNVLNLTPSDFNASRSGVRGDFKSSRNWMAVARNDLRQAVQDAMKIIKALKALSTTTITPTSPNDVTSSVTPTVTPTPTPSI
ncbi:MAG TPA: hypothetical protein VLG12_04960 [Candidatus Saccharimonadales bacterium]|nr:hypothetical protein [Candidatus Saccharimonadales bacterium]